MAETVMQPSDLVALRKTLGLTQSTMSAYLAMSLRGYQELEGGTSSINGRTVLAAERLALRIAAARGDWQIVPPAVLADVREVAALLVD